MADTFSYSGLEGSGTGSERVWNLVAHPALLLQMVGHMKKYAFQSAAPRTSALLSLNAAPGSGAGSQQGKPVLQSLAGALQGKKKSKKSWLAHLQSGTAIYPCICISAGQHSDTSAAYLLWPTSGRANHGSPEERASYFYGLQKDVLSEQDAASFPRPRGHQATTLLELMTVRAFHSKALRRHSLGTALGFRIRGGVLTSTPAIVVFVARKVHMQWLLEVQRLPTILEGPGGVWCDVDVLEFSHYTAPTAAPREPIHGELVEGLRGNDPYIGSGSQVASQETYGTLGAVVRSQTGLKQLGFLTNRHVAVDLDYPNQKMFHPLPPKLGPGVFLGAVERATSFVTDDLWYGIFAGMNPESFVRADGAFIPFTEAFDLANVTTTIKGVGEMGEVMNVDLQGSIDSVVGKQVLKVGRSSGLTRGVIMAYAVEYNDENGICFFTDFLIVGENKQSFDLEGDSGSLILVVPAEPSRKPRPIGIIWGGTANRGRLKLRNGHGPENWTSGVDLGRLLNLLQLDLVTTDADLQVEMVPQSQEYIGKKLHKALVDHSLRPDTSTRSFLTYPSREGETQADQPGFAPRGAEGRRVSREWEAEYRAPEDMGISLSGISHREPDSGSRHDSRKNVQEDASLGLGLFDAREAKRRRSST